MRKSTTAGNNVPAGEMRAQAVPLLPIETTHTSVLDNNNDIESSGPLRRRVPNVSNDSSSTTAIDRDDNDRKELSSFTGRIYRFLSTCRNNTICKTTIGKATTKNNMNRRYGRMLCFTLSLFIVTSVLSLLSTSRDTGETEGTLDFVTAGFLKCGTSTLLFAFAAHPEIQHHQHEMCLVNRLPSFLGDWGLRHNVQMLQNMEGEQQQLTTSNNSTVKKKMGMKCPSAIMNENAIQRINKHSPNSKFVVTLRNPILMVESMYNYIVIVAHRFKVPFLLPSFQSMVNYGIVFDLITFPATFLPIGGGILHLAKYEEYLGNFKRSILMTNNNNNKHDATTNNNARIFLLTLDQLKDSNETRNEAFRKDLQDYLGLQQPIRSMVTPENKNWNRGERAFSETIDICDDNTNPFMKQVRTTLLERAQTTVDWIEHQFITDPGVQISHREFFVQGLRSWTVDPCDNTDARKEM